MWYNLLQSLHIKISLWGHIYEILFSSFVWWWIIQKFKSNSKNLSKRYKANRNSPIPYIPLEVLENPNIDKLNLVIDKVLKPYKFFKVELSSKVSVSDTSKTLNLQIHDIGYIKRLSRLLSDNLKLHGFNTKSLNANENIHLTLANMNYFNKEVKKIDGPTELKSNLSTLKVNRLELWKISNNRREILIQTYPLKHF